MANSNELIITNDKQLEAFGIFTTESHQPDQGPFLSRQDFRDAQERELDTYPTDELFQMTILAAFDLHNGADLRGEGWTKPSRAISPYVLGRRPSQPDFLINPEQANEVLLASRYRDITLSHDGCAGVDRQGVSVLRRALGTIGVEGVMTVEEIEQPLQLSGGVYMSPVWKKKLLENDPFMLTLSDFMRHARKLRIDGTLVHAAFRCLGSELLDIGSADSTESHQFAHSFLHASRYVDSAVGLLSLDSPAAYRTVFEGWRQALASGGELPFLGDVAMEDREWASQNSDKLMAITQEAIAQRIPNEWFKRDGRFAPPPREFDF